MQHKDTWKLPCSLCVFLAQDQWIERPPTVQEVMGSIPIGDFEFFVVHPRVILISALSLFYISLPSLKFITFIHSSEKKYLYFKFFLPSVSYNAAVRYILLSRLSC